MMVRLPTIVLVYFEKTVKDQSSVLHVRTWPEPKAAICKPQSQLSPGTKSASSFILSFPASRTVKNKCLSFKKTQSSVFCYSSPSWLTHWGDDSYVKYSLCGDCHTRSPKSYFHTDIFFIKIFFYCFLSAINMIV